MPVNMSLDAFIRQAITFIRGGGAAIHGARSSTSYVATVNAPTVPGIASSNAATTPLAASTTKPAVGIPVQTGDSSGGLGGLLAQHVASNAKAYVVGRPSSVEPEPDFASLGVMFQKIVAGIIRPPSRLVVARLNNDQHWPTSPVLPAALGLTMVFLSNTGAPIEVSVNGNASFTSFGQGFTGLLLGTDVTLTSDIPMVGGLTQLGAAREPADSGGGTFVSNAANLKVGGPLCLVGSLAPGVPPFNLRAPAVQGNGGVETWDLLGQVNINVSGTINARRLLLTNSVVKAANLAATALMIELRDVSMDGPVKLAGNVIVLEGCDLQNDFKATAAANMRLTACRFRKDFAADAVRLGESTFIEIAGNHHGLNVFGEQIRFRRAHVLTVASVSPFRVSVGCDEALMAGNSATVV